MTHAGSAQRRWVLPVQKSLSLIEYFSMHQLLYFVLSWRLLAQFDAHGSDALPSVPYASNRMAEWLEKHLSSVVLQYRQHTMGSKVGDRR